MNCEEIHNKLTKLNCRSHVAESCTVAMIRGLRQALTRVGCLQAFESGPTVEEPCPAEMADYDRLYCDNVTGARPSPFFLRCGLRRASSLNPPLHRPLTSA